MVRFKILRTALAAALLCSAFLHSFAASKSKPSVAVVTDSLTYYYAREAIDSYLASMALDGKKGILLLDKWGVPDSIRVALWKLHSDSCLEGAVLVGDVPVAMIRDAQHLSSAFKMDQKRPIRSSSVPSDRFYDTFSLEFKYLQQDSERKELFYYSLLPSSAQRVRSNIYTSRIKPSDQVHKYELIDAFLRKAVRAKEQQAELNRMLLFAGHGYNSESMVSRMAEYKVLYEQIPSLNEKGSRLDFINFDFDTSVKDRLLSSLEQVDLAVLHHHGYNDMQLLNGSPYASSPDAWLDLAKNYFRGKMRSSRNPSATAESFISRFGIPEKWLEEASDSLLTVQDSLYERSMDIYPEDVDKYSISARFVIFDACFNGEFTEEDYIVSHYLFSDSNSTLAGLAHSVNSLQDVWPDELIGLFDQGVCAGNIYRNVWNLETHLFGDPTFHFSAISKWDRAASGVSTMKERDWRKVLEKEQNCELKSLAIKTLARSSKLSAEELLSLQGSASSPVVRLAAFTALVEMAPDCLDQAILMGLDDDYELLQRLAARYSSYNQSPLLAPKTVQMYLDPLTPKRVLFHTKSTLVTIPAEEARSLVEKTPYWKGEEEKQAVIRYIDACAKSTSEDIKNLRSPQVDLRSAKMFIRSQRNQCRCDAIEPMVEFYSRCEDGEVKLLIAETLGWYRYSYRCADVIDFCRQLLSSETDPRLREELEKGINRLSE
ncbi:MAG: HEAT repeat domain-containing protein [Candidatus Cryptobacteroides sp.]